VRVARKRLAATAATAAHLRAAAAQARAAQAVALFSHQSPATPATATAQVVAVAVAVEAAVRRAVRRAAALAGLPAVFSSHGHELRRTIVRWPVLDLLLIAFAWLASSAAMGLVLSCWMIHVVLDVSFGTALSVALSIIFGWGEREGRFARETMKRR
jgi:hypothetical protein